MVIAEPMKTDFGFLLFICMFLFASFPKATAETGEHLGKGDIVIGVVFRIDRSRDR